MPSSKLWLFPLVMLSVSALAQEAVPNASNEDLSKLQQDLPPGTLFNADKHGRFTSCTAPDGRNSPDFRKRCSAFLKSHPLMRAMSPIGDVHDWVRPSDYPSSAAARNAEGRSRIRVTVETDGSVSNCVVVESSGFAELDNAACNALLKRARFRPARNFAGEPSQGKYSRAVNWNRP